MYSLVDNTTLHINAYTYWHLSYRIGIILIVPRIIFMSQTAFSYTTKMLSRYVVYVQMLFKYGV